MTQAFALQLGPKTRKTSIGAQKIVGITLELYGIIVSILSISDKSDKERFFKESFLLTNIKLDIILKIFFLTISNTNIDFLARDLQQRSYITRDILSITRKVGLIEKKEFIVANLDSKPETLVVHIATLSVASADEVHLSKRAQIAHLKADRPAFVILCLNLIVATTPKSHSKKTSTFAENLDLLINQLMS